MPILPTDLARRDENKGRKGDLVRAQTLPEGGRNRVGRAAIKEAQTLPKPWQAEPGFPSPCQTEPGFPSPYLPVPGFSQGSWTEEGVGGRRAGAASDLHGQADDIVWFWESKVNLRS